MTDPIFPPSTARATRMATPLKAFPVRRRKGFPFAKFFLLLAALAGLSAGGWYGLRWYFAGKADATITATVTRGDLVVTVTERGELESSQTVAVKCELEREQAKLVAILPEGTRVTKGQVVGSFDTDAIQRSILEQEVKFKQADGKAKAAKLDLEITQNKGEGEIDKALLALKLAELDRDAYLEAEFGVELATHKSAMELARKQFSEAEDNLEFTRTLVKKGFEQQEKIRQMELGVQQQKFSVDSATNKLMLLEKYTKLKKETELNAKARDAKRDLDRSKKSTEAANDKGKADLEAAQQTATVEKQTLDRSRKQLTQCEIKAPADGIIVYFKRPWDESSRIQPGAMMFYQQPIFNLPDLTKMMVKVKVHESVVKKVTKGLSAGVLIDALPNQPLEGTVESVGTLAHSEGWRGGAVKEYMTDVSLKSLPADAGLKPGMTAEVKIFVKTVPNALLVPVQAVTEKGGIYYAYAKIGKSYERREVKVGEANEQFVQVLEGVQENEEVALDARARANAELKVETKDKKDEKPAPASATPAAAPAPVGG